jgi:branched-chain amino acid transport system substrate-binding protein
MLKHITKGGCKMKKCSVILLSIGLITSLITIGLASAQPANKPIKVGLIYDFTGMASEIAEGSRRGADMVFEEINNSGGILGRKVETVVRDSALKPELGAREAKELILNEKVNVIFGAVSSGVVLAITSVCKQNKTIHISTTGNTEALTGKNGHRYGFCFVINTIMEGANQALQAVERYPQAKKWYVMAPDYQYGHDNAKAFRAGLKKLNPGAEVIAEAFPKFGETEFGTHIRAMIGKKPDAALITTYGADAIALIKQGLPLGLFDIPMIAAFSTDVWPVFSKESISKTKAIVCTDRGPFYYLSETNPMADRYVKKYITKYGATPNQFFITTASAVLGWVRAVQEAGTDETEAVIRKLENLKWDCLYGPIYTRACDHQASFPSYSGMLAWSEKWKMILPTNVIVSPAEKLWRTCEESLQLRTGK